MPVDIKGSFLKGFISDGEALKKGTADFVAKKTGYRDFYGASFYSEEVCLAVILAACEFIYDNKRDESLFKTGQLVARVHLHNSVANTMLRVVGGFMFSGQAFSTRFLQFIESAIKTASPSLVIKIENPDKNTLTITFFDTKMPPKIFEGEWYEIFTALSCNVSSSSQRNSNNEFTVTLISDSFKNLEEYAKKTSASKPTTQ